MIPQDPLAGLAERRETASRIRSVREAVAAEVTEEFLVRHPDWLVRYGERARRFGIEDAGYHQDYLAAAIESGRVEAFDEYAVWAARILKARQIEPRFLIEELEQIGAAIAKRLPSAGEVVERFIRSGVARVLSAVDAESDDAPGPLDELARLYSDAAMAGRRQAALNLVLEGLREGHSVIDLYADVLQQSMYRIGRLWAANRISVAKEHMATAITQYVMAQIYPRIPMQDQVRGSIVMTGVKGEMHQIGANMVADVLETGGWDVRFLGADAPTDAVVDAVEEHRAQILGISATMLYNLPQVAKLAEAARRRIGGKIRILVGGRAFRSTPELYREMGADGCGGDLRSAIELVTRVAGRGRESGSEV